jgi:hypothetical protein
MRITTSGANHSMSTLGQKQTLQGVRVMSALPPKADIARQRFDVRFVPFPDIATLILKLQNSQRRTTIDVLFVGELPTGMCRSPLIVAAMMPAAGAHGKIQLSCGASACGPPVVAFSKRP